jgi:hypothetical protein
MKNLLKLPFRNPKEFYAYYSRVLFSRPGFLRTFFIAIFRRSPAALKAAFTRSD